jgi:hypothetical protein
MCSGAIVPGEGFAFTNFSYTCRQKRHVIATDPCGACRAPILFVTLVIDAAFALSLLGFLIMHANLLLRNCTTVEMYEKRRTAVWPYDNGARKNFLEVFGGK